MSQGCCLSHGPPIFDHIPVGKILRAQLIASALNDGLHWCLPNVLNTYTLATLRGVEQ